MEPAWNAIAREASLAAEHMGAGATILGKANYAHHAHYGQAFFSLSTGFERASKLAIVLDHALSNHGEFPSNSVVRGYGHNLVELLDSVDLIAGRRDFGESVRLPCTDIHKGIISVLSDFASNVTRYYNLELLTGSSRIAGREDPTSEWFKAVVEPVLARHYKAERQRRDLRRVLAISSLVDDITMVRHASETGEELTAYYDAALLSAKTEFANPYVRMYVLQIVRFVGSVLSDLGYGAYHEMNGRVPYISEMFAIFNNEDDYFRKRKTWSIYRP